MIIKTFQNVFRFQIFVPEKQGWLRYRPSWDDDGIWLCEFHSQDCKRIEQRRSLTAAYAEDVWERFKTEDTCETTYVS